VLEIDAVTTLLCDADGTLFGSEEPAFEASVKVTNRCLAQLGSTRMYAAEELRLSTNGQNFRNTITSLARGLGVAVDEEPFRSDVETWVAEENALVTAHLAGVLTPDAEVSGALDRLSRRYRLAVVTSSSLARIGPCLDSAGLDHFFPTENRFSAQESLPVPTSKPDPAVYLEAGRVLGLRPDQAVAIEDATAGAESAVRAGFVTIGMLCFVPEAERAQRVADLERIGVAALVDSWSELERLLAPTATTVGPVDS
jgi:beta-phosphoglucomutase-like phosphatase (HAD superfamily)